MRESVRASWSGLRCELVGVFLALSVMGNAAFAASPVVITLPASSSEVKIQKALDSLPPDGEVVLSPGEYVISQPLMLHHDYETLSGSGPTTILRLADKAACPVVILGPPMKDTTHTATHLRLANLMIDGNRKNQPMEFWRSAGDGSEFNNNGVQIWNVADSEVNHVVCCRCRSGGLVTVGVRRLEVNDYRAYDNQFDGLACYETEDSHFNNLHLHNNLGAGISLDLAFNHNSIIDAVLSANDLGIFMRHSRNNSFHNLVIYKSRHDGVFIAQAGVSTAKGWILCPHTECIGNHFEDLTISNCGGKAIRINDATCVNNIVLDAHCQYNQEDNATLAVIGKVASR